MRKSINGLMVDGRPSNNAFSGHGFDENVFGARSLLQSSSELDESEFDVSPEQVYLVYDLRTVDIRALPDLSLQPLDSLAVLSEPVEGLVRLGINPCQLQNPLPPDSSRDHRVHILYG